MANVLVSVHDPGGGHRDSEATVVLKAVSGSTLLPRQPGQFLYQADIAPGEYTLSVTADGLVSPDRRVTVPSEGRIFSAYLGEPGWPFYRMGENIIPYEPHEDLVAICFEHSPPPDGQTRISKLVSELELEFLSSPSSQHIWVFRVPASRRLGTVPNADVILAHPILDGLAFRVGMPIDLRKGQVKVLDRYFLCKFKSTLTEQQIDSAIETEQGLSRRKLIQSPNLRLVEFRSGTYWEHLETIERWIASGILVYGEPALITEVTDDDPPNDTEYLARQGSLRLQNVEVAWAAMRRDMPFGDTAICVATMDTGMDLAHGDIDYSLVTCFDFARMQNCTQPTKDHGTAVFGIIAAKTDNNTDIAGIASTAHQIAAKYPPLGSVNYADSLLWAAGFDTGNPTPGWPAPPEHPADVINCSHGVNGMALSGFMDDTFRFLVENGRRGLGVVVVYSAGNDDQPLTGLRTWAAHPCTLAIGNTHFQLGVEVHCGSNFGPEIDLCAQGEFARTLTFGGTRDFRGTSAAAPMVSAAAALMLSVNPGLYWSHVHDLLCDNADQVDPYCADPTGHWVGNFSQWYGHGRLNIGAAVQAALLGAAISIPPPP